MSKKGKFLLNLSAIAVVVAIGAQFYTNYKIDQTLKQFPYHFNHQFSIQVEERNSDFFTRDLVFSVQQGEENAAFIHTELTALPFAIQAQSYLTADIIKILNQKLNITIDKHHISSRFAVFTNELQSVVNTEFRDMTNTSQTQEAEVTYSTQNKTIRLNTELSGWNSEQINLQGLSGEYVLNPIANSEYALNKADLAVKNIKINLLDGEESHIELHKGKYELRKTFNQQHYDLSTSAFQDSIIAYNKNTKETDKQVSLKGFSLSTEQKNIPADVHFYQQMENLDLDNLTTDNIINLVTDFLFNNDQFKFKLNLNSLNAGISEKYIQLNQAQFEFDGQHKTKNNALQNYRVSVGGLQIKSETNDVIDFQLKNASSHLTMSHIDLESELAFLKKYAPQQFSLAFAQKDNAAFMKDLEQLAENYQIINQSAVKIGEVSAKDLFSLKDLSVQYQDKLENNQIWGDVQLNFNKLVLNKENMQFNDTKLVLPMNMSPKNELAKHQFCTQGIHTISCLNQLSEQTYNELSTNLLLKMGMNVKNATFETWLDTATVGNNKQKLIADLSFSLPESGNSDNIFAKFFQAEVKTKLTVPTALFKELNEHQENDVAKIKKETTAWQDFYQFISQNAVMNNENYHLEFSLEEGNPKLNGVELNNQ